MRVGNTFTVGTTVLLLLVVGSANQLDAQETLGADCNSRVLTTASSQYDVGMFDETIGRLRPCLPDGFQDRDEKIGAYRLLALSYILTDSLDQAKSSVRQLLRADRKYEPDRENDPPLFAEMVQDAKPGWYTWFYKGNSLPQWIGRAAIVGAAVSVPLLLKGETVQPLPEPPALPTR